MKTLEYAVRFARQSTEFGIPPALLAKMVRHARRSAAAWVRYNDGAIGEAMQRRHYDRSDREGAIVEDQAAACGVRVSWPGMHPTLTKGRLSEPLAMP